MSPDGQERPSGRNSTLKLPLSALLAEIVESRHKSKQQPAKCMSQSTEATQAFLEDQANYSRRADGDE